jgi:transcriptional regulator of acetoin/glycerol metabolism
MNNKDLKQLRRSWLMQGSVPEGTPLSGLNKPVLNSWQRCLQFGLEANQKSLPENILTGSNLTARIEQRQELIRLVQPNMNYLHSLIAGSGGMVLLADQNGVIVHAIGDSEFVPKADRVLLTKGASWLEQHRGTNAIGTAIIEGGPVVVNGAEHFFETNSFLSCAAAPIFQPNGKVVGVLDISSDSRVFHPHTLGLVKTTVHSIERQLFSQSQSSYAMVLSVAPSPEGISSVINGLIGISEEGLILGIDRFAMSYLGISDIDIGNLKIQQIVDHSLSRMMDYGKGKMAGNIYQLTTYTGRALFFNFQHTKLNVFDECSSSVIKKDIAMAESEPELRTEAVEESITLRGVSRKVIDKTISQNEGNISKAARILGISRTTLYRYLKSSND